MALREIARAGLRFFSGRARHFRRSENFKKLTEDSPPRKARSSGVRPRRLVGSGPLL